MNHTKRILVISNNPFSSTQHNGKTLASFFKGYPAECISQLYFNPALPDAMEFSNYYRISDVEVLKSFINKSYQCGNIIDATNQQKSSDKSSFSKIKKTYLARWIRDIVWKSGQWNSELLNKWVEEFSPEIVFFLAGDSGFAYDVCDYISKKYKTKLVVYMTDDYILPRYEISPFFWIRRNYLLDKMRKIIKKSDLFVTISEEMGDAYGKIFEKRSIHAINMTESLYDIQYCKAENEIISLVYAGGLHYNRGKILRLLAEAIRVYNKKASIKAVLKIYSNQQLTSRLVGYLNVDGASEFCGGLDKEALKKVLNACDIAVHVESFDKRSVASTKLSISTKIPEYLSLKKCVLAIGPNKIASIKYLEDCAYCINDSRRIIEKVEILLRDKNLRKKHAELCNKKFESYHGGKDGNEKFLNTIINL